MITDELQSIHPLLVDKTRLVIMVFLLDKVNPTDFNTLLANLKLTKGNLSAHLRKLEEGKFISVKKEFVDKKPRSSYKSTTKGKAALINYLEAVEKTLKNIKLK